MNIFQKEVRCYVRDEFEGILWGKGGLRWGIHREEGGVGWDGGRGDRDLLRRNILWRLIWRTE